MKSDSSAAQINDDTSSRTNKKRYFVPLRGTQYDRGGEGRRIVRIIFGCLVRRDIGQTVPEQEI